MTVNSGDDISRALAGGDIHVVTVLHCVLDACDPMFDDTEQYAAVKRALSINPTAAVMLLASILSAVDAQAAEAMNEPPGALIERFRQGLTTAIRADPYIGRRT